MHANLMCSSRTLASLLYDRSADFLAASILVACFNQLVGIAILVGQPVRWLGYPLVMDDPLESETAFSSIVATADPIAILLVTQVAGLSNQLCCTF